MWHVWFCLRSKYWRHILDVAENTYARKQAPFCTTTRCYNSLNSEQHLKWKERVCSKLKETTTMSTNLQTTHGFTPQCSKLFQCCWRQTLCSGTCNVFRCQQKSHLCPFTLSLLVSTCNMATRLIPRSLLSTPLHSFTLYTPVWRLPPSSNYLDSFINILIGFACIKVATFLVRCKHVFNPLYRHYMLTDS